MRERSRGGRTLRAQKIVKTCPSCPTDICDFLENPQINQEMKALIDSLLSKAAEEKQDVEDPADSSHHPLICGCSSAPPWIDQPPPLPRLQLPRPKKSSDTKPPGSTEPKAATPFLRAVQSTSPPTTHAAPRVQLGLGEELAVQLGCMFVCRQRYTVRFSFSLVVCSPLFLHSCVQSSVRE